MNKIYFAKEFFKMYFSLEKEERIWIQKIMSQLQTNIFAGKPLGFIWLREKKYKNKRLLYFTNIFTKKVLLVAFVDKKSQKEVIKQILKEKDYYLSFISL